MNKNNAVYLVVVDDYPKDYYNSIYDELSLSPLSVKIQLRENGVMAGIEWALPTIIVTYLLKPFFEAFLQEAGKDAYFKTKEGIKKLVKRNLPVTTIAVAADTSPKKLSKNYDQSRTISIKAALHSNITFTVLFDESIKEDEYDIMLEGMFTSIEMMYEQIQNKYPESENKGVSMNELYLIADMSKRSWIILTRQQMMERYGS